LKTEKRKLSLILAEQSNKKTRVVADEIEAQLTEINCEIAGKKEELGKLMK